MKALLIWPNFPNSFWGYQETLHLGGLRSTNPPLGLITVAAMLPKEWEIRFSDRNVQPETEEDWAWCDLVIISAMIVQKADFRALIQKGVALGKKVAVGGPFPTSVPEFALEAGAHYLILDEGECTIPMFLQALERGEEQGIFRSPEKPDVTQTPIPRFDLFEEYIDAFWNIYEPMPFLKRTFRHFMMMNGWRGRLMPKITFKELRLFSAVCWRQGVLRSTRWLFWWQLIAIALRKPRLFYDYMTTLGVGEHFFKYRHEVRDQLLTQLATMKQAKAKHQEKESYQLLSVK
ncbi:MAG: DUF4070 domain-containing protein [Phormidium sp.]